ncbi:MAG: hypothetical protein HW421_2916 [Ignavibacteria bacterium]|nr:hypothetical protein [Ignavibacteria bacterium]
MSNIILQNQFGQVSENSLTIFDKSKQQTISLINLVSISIFRKNNIILTIIFVIFSILFLGALISGDDVAIVKIIYFIGTLMCLLISLAYYYGNYKMKLEWLNGNKEIINIPFSKTKEGKELYNVIFQKFTGK